MKYGFNDPYIRTKQELNQFVSDEDIIQHYYGPFQLGIYCYSPRGESSPSLMFDIYNKEIKWRDFGHSNIPRDAVEFYMYIQELNGKEVSYPKALNDIKEQVKKGTCSVNYKISEKVKVTALKYRKKFHPWELDYWNNLSISEEQLTKFKVYPCELWYNERLWHRSTNGDSCYVYLWNIAQEIWKVYRPNAPLQKIRGVLTKKKFFAHNITNHIQGWEYLPKTGKNLFITKSYKDVMIFDVLSIPAISPHSENMFMDEGLITELKKRFKNIYLNYDNDATGIKKGKEFADMHALKTWTVPTTYSKKPTDPADLVHYYGINELNTLLHNIL